MSIRVIIVGDHPWAESIGTIENIPGTTKIEVVNVFGTDMVKVHLDSGDKCFAANKNIRMLPGPPSPAGDGDGE